MKSSATRYGTVAVFLHWITALLIGGLFLSGTLAADTADSAGKIGFLQVHAPIGLSILVLTLLRLLWWRLGDTRPPMMASMPRWQQTASQGLHGLLYAAMIGMALSGLGLFLTSGAGAIVMWGAAGPLPDFDEYFLRTVHGAGATLTLVLVGLHVLAALWHQFGLKDGLMRRMWFGRGAA